MTWDNRPFIEFIKAQKEKAGVSYNEFARQIGVYPSTLKKWRLHGVRPGVRTQYRIAKRLGVPRGRMAELMAVQESVNPVFDGDDLEYRAYLHLCVFAGRIVAGPFYLRRRATAYFKGNGWVTGGE